MSTFEPSRRPLLVRVLLLLPIAASCEYQGALGDNLGVRPVAPLNGAGAPPKAGVQGARPVFRWSKTPAASRFELQVDDSCTSAASCQFPSPEVDETVTTTTFTPPAALATNATAPRVRRYYWRVRACHADVCGDWSPVRTVDVGRTSSGALNTDLNGDGFDDAVVSAPMSSAGAPVGGSFHVYLGGATPASTPALVVDGSVNVGFLGYAVAMVGDLNGDGFGDYVVRDRGPYIDPATSSVSHAHVYFGGAHLRAAPDVVLDCVDDSNAAVAGLGDVNGDGYDDLALGGSVIQTAHSLEMPSRLDVHFGGPAMANAPDLILGGEPGGPFADFFASSVAGVGDVNDDGFADFAVGAPGTNRVHVYFGGDDLDQTPDFTLHTPRTSVQAPLFGFSVTGVGDFNGDGVADLAVGEPASANWPGPNGAVHVYFGGVGFDDAPDATFMGRTAVDWFGRVIVGAGDVDGDGTDDLAVLTTGVAGLYATFATVPPDNSTRVDVFRGGAVPATTAAFVYDAGPSVDSRRGLAARDLDGDARPDLLVGRWSPTAAGLDGRVDVLLGAGGYAAPALTFATGTSMDEFGAAIAR